MAAIASVFFRGVFSPWISPAHADQYIAGARGRPDPRLRSGFLSDAEGPGLSIPASRGLRSGSSGSGHRCPPASRPWGSRTRRPSTR
jgi:hypothetical protein